MESKWTVPQVAKYDDLSKPWFVWFRYNGVLKTYKKGINYIKDYKGRERQANLLRDALHKKLKEGWSPGGEKLDVYNTELTLIEGARLGLERKKHEISKRTYDDYEAAVRFFIAGIKAIRCDYMLLHQTERIHVRQILNKCREIYGWSNKCYNKKLGYIKAVFSALVKWEIIRDNPFYKIESLPEQYTEANITATDEEVELIKAKLNVEFPALWQFISVIYHTGIRREELLSIKVDMIRMDIDEIKIPPEITKTSMYRNVPINTHLKKMFIEMNIHDCPGDYYLFGTFREHLNRPMSKHTDMMPAPAKLGGDCVTTKWRQYVKVGLGINVNLYSFKHLGGDKKLLAGIDLDTVRHMYGHTNKRMTERYVKTLTNIYKDQLIKLSPDL